MKISELLNDGIDILKVSGEAEYWNAAYSDAIQITRRFLPNEDYPLIESVRPSDLEDIKKYRKENFTNIAKSDYDMAITNIARVNESAALNEESIHSVVLEWLEKGFTKDGETKDFLGWLFYCLFPDSLEDANGVPVVFPVNPLNKNIAPELEEADGGLPTNERIMPELKWIPSALIRYKKDGVLTYIGGIDLVQVGEELKEYPFLFGVDEDAWYRISPKLVKKEVVYFSTIWYSHEFGFNPLIPAPSDIVKTPHNNYYRESYFDGFYKYAKDVLNAYDDNKAVRIRFNYPKMGMANMPCPECKGAGKILSEDMKGYHGCNAEGCSNGRITDPSIYSTLLAPEGSLIGGADQGDLLKFYSPDTAIMQHSFEVPFVLRGYMREILALDLLTGAGANASDKSLERRERYAYNLYSKISNGLYDAGEKILLQVAMMLISSNEGVVVPKIDRPTSFDIKSLTKLKEEAKGAPMEDRINKKLKAYAIDYKNDPVMFRKLQVAMNLYPVIILEDNEVKNQLAKGALTANDCRKGNYVMSALNSIALEHDIIKLEIADVGVLIEQYFEDMKIIVPLDPAAVIPLFPPDAE